MGQDGEANIQIFKLTLTFFVHYKAHRTEIIIIIIIIINSYKNSYTSVCYLMIWSTAQIILYT